MYNGAVKKNAFTLIELLVVIAIIGVLLSIVMVSLSTARAKARDARRVSDIKNIQLALETYYNDNLKYPTTLAQLTPTYISPLPTDPLGRNCGLNSSNAYITTGGNYCYTAANIASASTNCTASGAVVGRYHLAAVLEIAGNQGSGAYAQTAGAGKASYPCSASIPNTDFNGISTGCDVSGTTNGAAGGATTCYDVTN